MNNGLIHTGDFDHCLKCGSKDNSSFRYWCVDARNFCYVLCRNCRSGNGGSPDVFYGYGSGTHSEENIAYPQGHPQAGEPIPFNDKRSKAAAMKIAGVIEAGDRVHGARNEDMVPKNRKKYI